MTRADVDRPDRVVRADTPRHDAYERPRLTAYGSLAKLTRSGVGTVKEMTGPSNKQFP